MRRGKLCRLANQCLCNSSPPLCRFARWLEVALLVMSPEHAPWQKLKLESKSAFLQELLSPDMEGDVSRFKRHVKVCFLLVLGVGKQHFYSHRLYFHGSSATSRYVFVGPGCRKAAFLFSSTLCLTVQAPRQGMFLLVLGVGKQHFYPHRPYVKGLRHTGSKCSKHW